MNSIMRNYGQTLFDLCYFSRTEFLITREGRRCQRADSGEHLWILKSPPECWRTSI